MDRRQPSVACRIRTTKPRKPKEELCRVGSVTIKLEPVDRSLYIGCIRDPIDAEPEVHFCINENEPIPYFRRQKEIVHPINDKYIPWRIAFYKDGKRIDQIIHKNHSTAAAKFIAFKQLSEINAKHSLFGT